VRGSAHLEINTLADFQTRNTGARELGCAEINIRPAAVGASPAVSAIPEKHSTEVEFGFISREHDHRRPGACGSIMSRTARVASGLISFIFAATFLPMPRSSADGFMLVLPSGDVDVGALLFSVIGHPVC
jgi:hypothetical protein